MRQANALSDEFSLARGWTKEKVDSLLNDLSNHCLSPYGSREPIEDSLVGAACTVEIDDDFRAQSECPYLRGMTPEEVCVNYLAEVALRLLPEDPNGHMGKSGSVEMYFDQGERFMRTIHRPWQQHRKKSGLFDNRDYDQQASVITRYPLDVAGVQVEVLVLELLKPSMKNWSQAGRPPS